MSESNYPKLRPSRWTYFTPRDWWMILKRLVRHVSANNLSLIAAGVAFYGLLALFPGITALVAVVGLFTQPQILAEQLSTLTQIMPAEIATLVLEQFNAVVGADSSGLTFAAATGSAIAFYSASRGVESLMGGLNFAYDITEQRSFVWFKLRVFGLTVAIVFGIGLTLMAMAVLPILAQILTLLPDLGLGDLKDWVLWLRWPLVAVVAALGFSGLYRYGPSTGAIALRGIKPGAVLACLVWIAASFGFSWYVEAFGNYNQTFGALGGVIVLLMWLWLSAFIVLMGAAVDYAMACQRDEVRARRHQAQDTT